MQGEEPVDDRSLTMRARAGELAAFERLMEQYRNRVYSLALRISGSEADAAEICQEAFLSAYQHLDQFRGDSAFGTWVHRIAANLALSRRRHSQVVSRVESPLEELQFNPRGYWAEYPERDWSRGAEERALSRELSMAIRQAVDSLPPGYREVVLLKDLENLSYAQIAEIVGDSIPAIKSRLHRARLALRAAIDRFYNQS